MHEGSLVSATRDCPRLHQTGSDANLQTIAQFHLDVLFDLRQPRCINSWPNLDLERYRFVEPHLVYAILPDPHIWFDDIGESAQNDVANSARKNVHRLVDKHVVRAADAPDLGRSSAASTRGRHHDHMIGRAITQGWCSLALERRVNRLALSPILPSDARPSRRIDKFHRNGALRIEVHPAPFLALAPKRGHHIADAHALSDVRRSPASGNLRTNLRLTQAWLSAAHKLANAQFRRRTADQLMAMIGQINAERCSRKNGRSLKSRQRPQNPLRREAAEPGKHGADAPKSVGIGQPASHHRQSDQMGNDVLRTKPTRKKDVGNSVAPNIEITPR